MFEYTLPSSSWLSWFQSKPLITKIEIQGPYVTIYGRKKIGAELDGVIKEQKGKVIQGMNFEHATIHDKEPLAVLFAKQDEHVHYKLCNKNIPSGIANLVSAIYQRHFPEVRKKDYEEVLASIEADRVRAGHAELPDFVKREIKQIDTTSAFFLQPDKQALIHDILSKYSDYCKRVSNDRCRELIQMYIVATLKPMEYLLHKEPPSDEVMKVAPLLEPLVQIGYCLENARKEPLNRDHLLQIQNLLREVSVPELVALENPNENYVTEGTSLQERLDFVAQYAQNQLKMIEKQSSTDSICQVFARFLKTWCS